MEIYSDVSYAPPHEQHRSVQGIVVEHTGCVLSWESSRQGFVVQSTAEAELLSSTDSAGDSGGEEIAGRHPSSSCTMFE